MEMETIKFIANQQTLARIKGKPAYASNVIRYIQVEIQAQDPWTSFDSVELIFQSDRKKIAKIPELSDGVFRCTVPQEMALKISKVFMNLVGKNIENGSLVEKLTTYPCLAFIVNAYAQEHGLNEITVTANQYDQFVENVNTKVKRIEDLTVSAHTSAEPEVIKTSPGGGAYNLDFGLVKGDTGETGNGIADALMDENYALTLHFTDGTSYTTPSIRGATGETGQAGSDGANGEDGVSPTVTVTEIEGGHRLSITDAAGTSTADIMDGADGADGIDGLDGLSIASIDKTSTSGLVDTYTITYTDGSSTDVFNVTNGQDGERGTDGNDGFSPIATVSKSGDTATISITDKNGTTTSTVTDGADGEDGKQGMLFFGQVDSTSTSTAFTAQISGITEYFDGLTVVLKNGVVTSASGFTININSLGAKHAYSNMAAATAETTMFNINYTMMFTYDSTRVEGGGWILYRGYNSDNNTIGYQLRTNSMTLPMKSVTYRYRLLFTSADRQHWIPANNSTSTNATSSRNVCQDAIDPFGDIRYYGTTASVAANSRPSATALWQQYAIALGYSFNRTGAALTLTSWKPVYVKCAPQSDGSAIIDSTTPFVQDLPTTEDGKIYIYLGVAYSATNIELVPNHPVYWYKDGMIRLYPNVDNNGIYKALYGKKVVCFGDSLFGLYRGDDSAPAFVAEECGATVYNVGFGGCRMSVHPSHGYAEFSMWALAKAVAENDWTDQDAYASSGQDYFAEHLALLKSIDFSTIDCVVIHYGTNDFQGGVPLDDSIGSKDYNTICGALRYSIDKLMTAFPNLNVFVSLPVYRYWSVGGGTTYSDTYKNSNNITLPDVCIGLNNVAYDYSLPCIDGYRGLSVNRFNATNYYTDGTHHNLAGRERFGRFIGKNLISPNPALWFERPEPTYTNLLSQATDENGNIYYGQGYRTGYVISGSGAEAEWSGAYVTGFIPAAYLDKVYLRNVGYNKASTSPTPSNLRICFYDSTKTFLTGCASGANATAQLGKVYDSNDDLIEFQVANIGGNSAANTAYFRIAGIYMGDDSVITVNEPLP